MTILLFLLQFSVMSFLLKEGFFFPLINTLTPAHTTQVPDRPRECIRKSLIVYVEREISGLATKESYILC